MNTIIRIIHKQKLRSAAENVKQQINTPFIHNLHQFEIIAFEKYRKLETRVKVAENNTIQ